MVAMGCGMEGYMELNPAGLMGSLVAAAAAAAAAAALDGVLELPTGSTERRWLRSFSSRRHLALRLLNHTCDKKWKHSLEYIAFFSLLEPFNRLQESFLTSFVALFLDEFCEKF